MNATEMPLPRQKGDDGADTAPRLDGLGASACSALAALSACVTELNEYCEVDFGYSFRHGWYHGGKYDRLYFVDCIAMLKHLLADFQSSVKKGGDGLTCYREAAKITKRYIKKLNASDQATASK